MSVPDPGVSPRRCPVCAAQLKVLKKASLTIDVCDEHGVWLDRGELEALMKRGQLGRKARRRIEEAARREEQQRTGGLLAILSLL